MKTYKIVNSRTSSDTLSVTASVCEQTGTRNNEDGKNIPIIKCSTLVISILRDVLPSENKVKFVKTKIEEAYAELPNQTFSKTLEGTTWAKTAAKA